MTILTPPNCADVTEFSRVCVPENFFVEDRELLQIVLRIGIQRIVKRREFSKKPDFLRNARNEFTRILSHMLKGFD